MALLLGPACALAQTVPTLTLPSGTVTATVTTGYTSSLQNFPVSTTLSGSNLTSGGPYSVISGTSSSVNGGSGYTTWCFDSDGTLDQTRNNYVLYNTLSSTFYSQPAADPNGSASWNEVNWIINHKTGYSGTETYNGNQIQYAIWSVLDPYYGTSSDSGAATLAGEAKTYGSNFVPTAGQVIAVALYVDGIPSTAAAAMEPTNAQDLFIEVTIPTPVVCNGSIGTFLFLDNNSNGVYDQGIDQLLNGITVSLLNQSTGVTTTTVSGVTSNGVPGVYSFNGLCPGTYTVSVPVPTGDSDSPVVSPISNTITNLGSGSPSSYTVTLTSGTPSNGNVDFGFTPPCTGGVTGTIWSDKNDDGNIQSGEPGIPGVELVLFNDNNSQQYVAIAYTNSATSGLNYSFTGLCAGGYWIGIIPPSGYSYSPVTESSTNPAGSYGNGAKFTVTTDNTVYTPVNIGLYQPPSTPPTIKCPNVTSGTVGEPFSSTVSASGGSGSYSITLTSGSLPAGLSFSNGVISGTPTQGGSFNLTFTVTDTITKQTATTTSCGYSCSITIATPPPLTITCLNTTTSVQTGTVGSSFGAIVQGSGGVGPYTYTYVSGTMPAGLSFSNANFGGTNYGYVSGTPTQAGTFSNLVFQVIDSRGYTATTSSCGYNCALTILAQQCTVSGKCYTSKSLWGTQPVCNQQVTITGTDCYGNSVSKTVTTDNNGNYQCTGLNPGTYKVTAPQSCWFTWLLSLFQILCQGSNCINITPGSGAVITGCNFLYS